jgi:uncharacterized protein YceH (UPF0502 family)
MACMNFVLNEIEARVLGSLLEKDVTTPDYYPLSLNALVNACNQKNNREPVMSLGEDAVRQALRTLNEKGLAGAAGGADSRVTKYEHRLQEMFNFTRPETAVLCILLLRGPQTPGELRGRAERMYRFEELADVISALQHLMQRDPPLAKVLPRQPGTKESRYAHLLCGDVEGWETGAEQAGVSQTGVFQRGESNERLERLETEVAALRNELAQLKEQWESFRKQFE